MFRPLILLPLIAFASCDRERSAPHPPDELDPAVAAALAEPIMIDPDLAGQNRGNAAIAIDTFAAMPLDDATSDGAAAARAQATQMAGGTIRTPSDPIKGGALPHAVVTAGQLAAALQGVSAPCLEGLRYGYEWATKLPPALPIYPRGHVQEAAGNEACALQAVIFTTPVEPAAVVDFYFTKAEQAGVATRRRKAGDAEVLTGSKGAAAFVVRVRAEAGGISEVGLAHRN